MRYGITEQPQSVGKFSETLGVSMLSVQSFLEDKGYLERNDENKFVPTKKGLEDFVVDETEIEMDTKRGRETIRYTRILEKGKDMYIDHFELNNVPSSNPSVTNAVVGSKIDQIFRYIKEMERKDAV